MTNDSGQGRALLSGDYRVLLVARSTSMLGNSLAPVALAFAVLDLTGSATHLGVVVGARTAGNLGFLLLGGVIADRLPRSVILQASCLVAGATQGATAVLLLTGTATIWSVTALAACNGAAAAFSFPASGALLPQTVRPDQLQRANGLMVFCLNLAAASGAASAGFLVTSIGSGWCVATDAATFVAAAVLYSRIKIGASSPAAGARNLLMEFTTGWREIAGRGWLWTVLLASTVANAGLQGTLPVLGPVVADGSFGRSLWGLVLASQVLGLVLGGLMTARWSTRKPLWMGVLTLSTIALTPIALASGVGLPLVLVAAATAGIGLGLFNVIWETALQDHTPADRLARVYSVDAFGSVAAVPAGQVLAGPLSIAFGVGSTLFGAGALIAASSIAALASPSVRRLSAAPINRPIQ